MAGFDNDVLFAKNADFTQAAGNSGSESNGLFTNGQLWIGSTVVNVGGTHVNVGQIVSPLGTLTIGFSSPNITIDLAGSGLAIDSVNVDASTAPGTNPVAPNPAGQITITGAQVATGVIGTNVIRTDSLAPNTFTIEIQRSTAVAASDVTKNGVSHFDSARFTVGANGFVSLNGSGVGETITGDTGGALSPTAGNWNIIGGTVVAGSTPVATAGAVSTLTVNVQRSQAIASTDSTKIGLAAFNSAQFTVDANGFVSTTGNTMAWQQISANQTLVKNTGYFCISPGGALSLALPSTASSTIGDLIEVTLDGATSWTITQAASQQIRFSGSQTTAGATGTLASTAAGDSIRMVYQASGKWNVVSSIGNLTVT